MYIYTQRQRLFTNPHIRSVQTDLKSTRAAYYTVEYVLTTELLSRSDIYSERTAILDPFDPGAPFSNTALLFLDVDKRDSYSVYRVQLAVLVYAY